MHGQPVENSSLAASLCANIFTWPAVCGPACSGQPVSSVQENTFAGSAWLCQVTLIMSRLKDNQMFLNICNMPNFTVGLFTLLKTRGLNLCVDPSVMAAALEEAPISTRPSKSYQNAKIKEFGNIFSNPDRFCNQKQQYMAWISDLDASPSLEKNK